MKKIAYRTIYVLFFFSFILLLFEQHIAIIIVSYICAIIISLIYKEEPSLILHWINPFILLHNYGYSIYNSIVGVKIDQILEFKMIIMSLISFYTLNIVVLFFYEDFKIKKIRINKHILYLFWIVCLLSITTYLFLIFQADLSSKRMIKNFMLETPFIRYLYALTGLFITLSLYDTYKHGTNLKKVLLYSFLFSFIFLFLGERELLFTFVIGVLFFDSFKNGKFKIFTYYSFLLVVAFTAPYTQLLKSVLISEDQIEMKSEFRKMGFNDFMTVGKNIERVYNVNNLKKIEDKNLILADLGNFLKVSKNSGRWYSEDFLNRPQNLSGLGYSLELTGYMDMGYFGVFFVYFLVGLAVAWYSRIFTTSVLGLSFFVSLISLLIYIQRQDLAFFINFSIKFLLIPFLLLKVKIRYK